MDFLFLPIPEDPEGVVRHAPSLAGVVTQPGKCDQLSLLQSGLLKGNRIYRGLRNRSCAEADLAPFPGVRGTYRMMIGPFPSPEAECDHKRGSGLQSLGTRRAAQTRASSRGQLIEPAEGGSRGGYCENIAPIDGLPGGPTDGCMRRQICREEYAARQSRIGAALVPDRQRRVLGARSAFGSRSGGAMGKGMNWEKTRRVRGRPSCESGTGNPEPRPCGRTRRPCVPMPTETLQHRTFAVADPQRSEAHLNCRVSRQTTQQGH
jgi:hypothetical protein